MRRRESIIKSVKIITGLIFVPKLIRAQVQLSNAQLSNTQVLPVSSGGSPCTTLRDTFGTSSGNLWDNTTYLYFASSFDASASYPNCTQIWSFKRTGNPPGTVKGAIYDNATDRPGSIVGTAGDTVNVSTIGTSQGDITLPNIAASLTNGTHYWAMAIFSVAGMDASNKIEGYYGFDGIATHEDWVSTNGSTWAKLEGSSGFKGAAYST
jgi:hypothetical protein